MRSIVLRWVCSGMNIGRSVDGICRLFMNRAIYFAAIASSVCIFMLPYRAAQAEWLYGGLEHQERLAPVDAGLKTGAVYDDPAAEKMAPGNDWFRIADWLGGRWQEGATTTISELNYQTNQEKKIHHVRPEAPKNLVKWGWQQDARGDIWHFCQAPYHYTVTTPRYTEHLYVSYMNGVEVNKKSCTVRFIHKNVRTDNNTGRVIHVYQLDSLHTFIRKDKDHVLERDSTKYFDEDGNPTKLVVEECALTRCEPFIAAQRDGKRDLQKLFADYLDQAGLSNLSPNGQ